MARRPKSNVRCGGLTLLELILALALSVLVISAISMAISIHLRLLDSRRASVEKSQLARILLVMMAQDIRAAVQQKPVDVSQLEAMLADIDLEALASGEDLADIDVDELAGELLGSGEDGQESSDSTLDELAGLAGDEGTSPTVDISTTVAPTPVPGIFGNMEEISIDVSRLPRFDQWNPGTVNADVTSLDIPSDIKTVAYFLGANSATDGADQLSADNAIAGATGVNGLYRRQLDRSITTWAADNGASFDLNSQGELMAEEVQFLQFMYYDGTSWLEEWDSDASGALPIAVEIIIGLADTSAESSTDMFGSTMSHGTEVTDDGSFYRLVVHLPMAEIPDPAMTEDEAMMDEMLGGDSDFSSGSQDDADGGAR